MSEVRVETRILKADTKLGIAFGYAIVSKQDGADYVDLHGHHISDAEIVKAFDKALTAGIEGKAMHEGGPVASVSTFPLTEDIAEQLGIIAEKYGLLVAIKPHDPALIAKIASGEFTGFSIGCEATELPDAEAA